MYNSSAKNMCTNWILLLVSTIVIKTYVFLHAPSLCNLGCNNKLLSKRYFSFDINEWIRWIMCRKDWPDGEKVHEFFHIHLQILCLKTITKSLTKRLDFISSTDQNEILEINKTEVESVQLGNTNIADMDKCPQDKCCLNKCRGDSCHLLFMFPGPFV